MFSKLYGCERFQRVPRAWDNKEKTTTTDFRKCRDFHCRKAQRLKIEFLGRIFLGHQGPRHRTSLTLPWDVLDKTLCEAPRSVVLDREWSGCPAFGSGRPGLSVLTWALEETLRN